MKVVNYPLMPIPVHRDPTTVSTEFISTAEGLIALNEAVKTSQAVAVDTETHDAITLQDGTWAAVRVISVATRHQTPEGATYRKFVVDVKDIEISHVANSMSLIPSAYAWNANFDDRVLRYLGAPVKTWHDVMLDEQISFAGIDGRGWYLSLAVAAKRYIAWEVTGKGGVQTSFDAHSTLSSEQIDYAADDALVTLWLAEAIGERVETHGLSKVSKIEQGARPFIAMMMEEGFPFRSKEWEEILIQKRRVTLEALAEISAATGGTCDLKAIIDEVGMVSQSSDSDLATAVNDVLSTITNEWDILANVAHLCGDEKAAKGPYPTAVRAALSKIAPSWNTNSEFHLRTALNTHDAEAVKARFGRLMDDADQVDKATMGELAAAGSKVTPAVMRYREAAKYVTTYGGEFLKYVRDGRIRSRYKQALTSTGRLSSFEPNGQNLVGPTKEYISPAEGRVLCAADYSQAELRVLASLSGEEPMLEAFREGLDLHEMTAKRILGIDIAEMKKTDPKEAKAVRTKCKRLNFGIPYGLGAAALARQLTLEGVPTSLQEAQELLNGYDKQYPKVAAWLNECGKFSDNLAKNPGPIDWVLSFKLLKIWQAAEQKRKSFKRTMKRLPSSRELAEQIKPRTAQLDLFASLENGDQYEAEVEALAAGIDWAFGYDAPVVLRPGGEPLAWEIRTTMGRRRLFTVAMDSGFKRSETEFSSSASSSDKFDGLVTSAMLVAATTDKPQAAAVRDSWAAANKVSLPSGTDRCVRQPNESMKDFRERSRKHRMEERTRCVKAFEGGKRHLKTAFVEHMCEHMGPGAAEYLLSKALSDQIRKSGNALRNYRIQASVADLVEIAFASLYEMCEEYPDLRWVQSVHDSIVGECDEANGLEIGQKQQRLMEEAMSQICPGVPAKVDAEVCRNLGESGIIAVISSASASV